MKIALLEPIGVPGEIIKAFGDKLQGMGHEFVSYEPGTSDDFRGVYGN